MSDAKTPAYKAGSYKVRIVPEGQGFGVSKSEKKTRYFAVGILPLAYIDPVTKEETPPSASYERTITLYLTTGTWKFAEDKIKALGWDGQSLQALDPDTPGFQDLSGNEFTAYCKHTSSGYEEWDISTGSGGRPAKITSKEGVAADLDELFFGAGTVRHTPVTKTPVPDLEPDDLPF